MRDKAALINEPISQGDLRCYTTICICLDFFSYETICTGLNIYIALKSSLLLICVQLSRTAQWVTLSLGR